MFKNLLFYKYLAFNLFKNKCNQKKRGLSSLWPLGSCSTSACLAYWLFVFKFGGSFGLGILIGFVIVIITGVYCNRKAAECAAVDMLENRLGRVLTEEEKRSVHRVACAEESEMNNKQRSGSYVSKNKENHTYGSWHCIVRRAVTMSAGSGV